MHGDHCHCDGGYALSDDGQTASWRPQTMAAGIKAERSASSHGTLVRRLAPLVMARRCGS